MSENVTSRVKQSFVDFAQKMEKITTSRRARSSRGFRTYGESRQSRYAEWTVENIREIISVGDPAQLERLSSYFYRNNGIYAHMIDYLANLLLYDAIIIPKRTLGARISNSTIRKRFNSAISFAEELDVAITFTRVTKLALIHGVYYGLMRDFGENQVVLQDLDPQYCRTLYKSPSGVDLIEFNL